MWWQQLLLQVVSVAARPSFWTRGDRTTLLVLLQPHFLTHTTFTIFKHGTAQFQTLLIWTVLACNTCTVISHYSNVALGTSPILCIKQLTTQALWYSSTATHHLHTTALLWLKLTHSAETQSDKEKPQAYGEPSTGTATKTCYVFMNGRAFSGSHHWLVLNERAKYNHTRNIDRSTRELVFCCSRTRARWRRIAKVFCFWHQLL